MSRVKMHHIHGIPYVVAELQQFPPFHAAHVRLSLQSLSMPATKCWTRDKRREIVLPFDIHMEQKVKDVHQSNVTRQTERCQNPSDLSHASIWWRAHRRKACGIWGWSGVWPVEPCPDYDSSWQDLLYNISCTIVFWLANIHHIRANLFIRCHCLPVAVTLSWWTSFTVSKHLPHGTALYGSDKSRKCRASFADEQVLFNLGVITLPSLNEFSWLLDIFVSFPLWITNLLKSRTEFG